MGEVYRADDLAVEQPVALKLLRPELAREPLLVDRLRAEVRLARRVTHPNVCRVHDLGQLEEQPFLSMEYVDGEDLDSLLRRAGRLTTDRALGIARQICAGLGAAHARGVLHRDLKPANVLVDAGGQVKLTDFGLALDADEDAGALAGAGTPAYMAPEQLAGAPASEVTDLYSLGVVLWELLTGARLFGAIDPAELRAAHAKPVPPLSEVVPEIDRDLERVVMQCLSRDPAARPPSALSVLAAFPGNDILSAAMAAGEPPSPELVAAVGEHGALAPRTAALLGTLGLLLLCLVAWFDHRVTTEGRSHLPLEPAVLAHRASEMLRAVGHRDDALDSAYGFARLGTTLRWVGQQGQGYARWDRLAEAGPPALVFWYRESPNWLVPHSTFGRVGISDPSIQTEGQRLVWLSPRGELLLLATAPPFSLEASAQSEGDPDEADKDARGPASPKWPLLLELAGIEETLDTLEDPGFIPPFAAEDRIAWRAKYPGTEDVVVDVVGASSGSSPVYFHVLTPGMGVFGRRALHGYTGTSPSAWAGLVFQLAMLVGGALLARRHWSRGWGDRRGGQRLFFFVLGLSFVSWVLGAHHVSSPHQEYTNLARFLGGALFDAGLVWIAYLAFEPIVRRRWPDRLISWSRLTSGRWRDPLVGRGLVAAVLIALAVHFVTQVQVELGWRFGQGLQLPIMGDPSGLGRPRIALAALLETTVSAIIPALGFVVLFVLVRMVVRIERLAAVLVVIMGLMLKTTRDTSGYLPLDVSVTLAHGLLMYFLIVRQGLLTLVVSIACILVLMEFPLLPDPRSWLAGASWLALAFVGGLLFLGLRLASPRLRLGG